MNEFQKQLEQIAFSDQTYNKITMIGEKYSLMIDEQGELAAEIRDVVTGFKSAKNLLNDLKDRLEIDNEKANNIISDINQEILIPIRELLQKTQEGTVVIPPPPTPPTPPQPIPPAPKPTFTPPPIPPRPTPPPPPKPVFTPPIPVPPPPPSKNINLSDIERVGEFTLEKRPPSHSPQYNDNNLDRDTVLREIEQYEHTGSKEGMNFVDHLLNKPISNPEQRKEIKPETKIENKTEIKSDIKTEIKTEGKTETTKYTADPYREPVE